MSKDLLATVDLGSNSFRLLVAKVREDGSIYPVDEIRETVRLAGGLDNDNNLIFESMERAWLVLSRFGERLVGFSKSHVRVVATSTLRIAKNAEEFIIKGNKLLNFDIEVISGIEEARLIYIGAMHSVTYINKRCLVVDIGGGSTEFIVGTGFSPHLMESVTIGCVSFSNRFFGNFELFEENFVNAILSARSEIQAKSHLLLKAQWRIAIGTSGTAIALNDLCIAHGFSEQITLVGLYKLKDLFIKQRYTKNLKKLGLKPDRCPVIAGGLSIMIAILEQFNINSMIIADGALREGVMYDLLGRESNQDLREETVKFLKKHYNIDKQQSKLVSTIGLKLVHDINKEEQYLPQDKIKLLQWATELYEIGLSISHHDYHKHGAYILANADLAGFSRPEQMILADLVRAHRRSLHKVVYKLTYKNKVRAHVILMVLIFRLAVIFARNRKPLPDLNIIELVVLRNKNFELIIYKSWLNQNPLSLHLINEEILQWQRLNIKITLNAD